MAERQGTVYVVDDDGPFRDAVVSLLQSVDIPVRQFASGIQFKEQFDPEASGCILLDLYMPGVGGLELLHWLKAQAAPIPVIMLSGLADIALAVEAIKSGAVDFIEKPFDPRLLLNTVRRCLTRTPPSDYQETAVLRARLCLLTDREAVILNRVTEGDASKVIALELGVSRRTVDVHRSNIMKKLGVRNAAELVRLALYARSRGLIREHPAAGAGSRQA